MEYFDDLLRRQDVFQIVHQSMVKRIHLEHVEQVAMILETQLDQSYWLPFDKSFTIKPKYWWWLALFYNLADGLDILFVLDHGVG